MLVMKFGGTSVGSAERMRATAEIIRNSGADRMVVVLSAMSGATNELLAIAAGADAEALLQRHADTVAALGLPARVMDHIREVFAGARTEQEIVACGEQFSTAIMLAYLYKHGVDAAWLPALDYMRLDADGNPDVEQTGLRARRLLNAKGDHKVYITQGFIGRNAEGAVATLSRGGSDFTATLLGEALGADEVQIWTDVDGVYSADPRVVPAAGCIPELSYELADTAARLGAKILHPDCVQPAKRAGYSLRVLDSFHPEAAGTLIGATADCGRGFVAVAARKAADEASLADVSLIGCGADGADDAVARVSRLLQPSSVEVTATAITARVAADKADEAVRALHKDFIEK